MRPIQPIAMSDDWSHEVTDDPLTPAQLSSAGELLGSQSLQCVRFNFCCTATDVAATLAASMALRADTDDYACEALAASATTGGA
jgi:hypothetical protein